MKSSKYASSKFWIDAFDRCLASFAQSLVTVGAFESAGIIHADWEQILSLSAGYALVSLATSIAWRGGAGDKAPGGGA